MAEKKTAKARRTGETIASHSDEEVQAAIAVFGQPDAIDSIVTGHE